MQEVHDSAKGNHDKRANGEAVNGEKHSPRAAATATSPSASTKRTTSTAGISNGHVERGPSRPGVFSYDSSIAHDSITAQVSFDSGAKLDTLRPIEESDQVVPVLSPPPRSRGGSKGKQSSANLIVSPTTSTKAAAPASSGNLLDDFIDFESESKQQEKAYRAQMQSTPATGGNPFSGVASSPATAAPLAPLAPSVPANSGAIFGAELFGGGSTSQAQLQLQQQQQQQQAYQLHLQQQQQQQMAYQQQMQMQMQMQHMSVQPQPTFNPFAGGAVTPAHVAQPAPVYYSGAMSTPVASTPAAEKDPFAGLWEASKNAKPHSTSAASATPAARPATNGTASAVDFPF